MRKRVKYLTNSNKDASPSTTSPSPLSKVVEKQVLPLSQSSSSSSVIVPPHNNFPTAISVKQENPEPLTHHIAIAPAQQHVTYCPVQVNETSHLAPEVIPINEHNGLEANNPPHHHGLEANNPPRHNGLEANNPPRHNGLEANNPPHHNGLEANNPPHHNGLEANNPPHFDSNDITLSPAKILEADLQFHTNTMLDTTTDVLNKLLNDHYYESDGFLQSGQESTPFTQSNTTNTNANTTNTTTTSTALPVQHNFSSNNNNIHFNSNYLNEEYLMLGDIILHSKPSSPSPSNTSASEYNTVSPSYIRNVDINNFHQSKRKVVQKLKDSRPFISLGFSKDSSMSLDNLNNMANQTDNLLDNNVTSRGANTVPKNNAGLSKTNPIIDFGAKYSMDYVSPLTTHHIYQTVSDIYSKEVLNFEYPNSYHALTHFLKKRFSGNQLSPEEKAQKRQNLLVILKLIASYRPTFISAHKSLLKPQDLLFLEMSFQRCLIDYEKLSQLNSSPTIIWRRTGEIVSITDDLLSLLGYKLSDILSKRTFIMEIMYDDESIVKYFQLFKSVAVGNLHSSISTKIKLIKNHNEKGIHKEGEQEHAQSKEEEGEDRDSFVYNVGTNEYIEFCSVWTVKRDLFDIPMLIIGQFLPIFPAGDGVRIY
ncbi:GSM1 [Candida oxycetoniae]|uniref:GSM1 n=1 Tax=Candida oxycetoniae TaxID=497107 RepID=A0AAI9SYZ9_9ASCO|nr:GSM1 [Candida oxycetoniae]KAI3405818.2 GSM1 [Candida oxycetoniae]